MRENPLNTLGLAHQFLAAHLQPGNRCIDATVGRGRDTLFLAQLVGATGQVIGLDIQPEAIDSARQLLESHGLPVETVYSPTAAPGVLPAAPRIQLYEDCHSHIVRYAAPESVDAIVFNFGWLPGGDHSRFSTAKTSVPAVEAALTLLKPGGVMSLSLYHGRNNGTAERDALLAFLATIDNRRYTVLQGTFLNRTGDIPVPVFLFRE